MEKVNKYICEKCNFKTNFTQKWNSHVETELHKTGIRKKHSNYKEPTKCTHCDYSTKNSTTLRTHLLNNHCTKEQRKSEFKFFCECCDYGSFYENFINVHNETTKHKNNTSLVKL